MKGELIRGGTTNKSGNVVTVSLKVTGGRVAWCEVCKMSTSHGVLEFSLTYCGLCKEVTPPHPGLAAPCECPDCGAPNYEGSFTCGGHGIRAYLIHGSFNRQTVDLSKTPPRIQIGDQVYHRIDDPDTGEYLGGYSYDNEMGTNR